MDTGYRANPEHFAMQMGVFERMRQTEAEFRAAARSAEAPKMPVNATREHAALRAAAPPSYPRGVIDLRRLTSSK